MDRPKDVSRLPCARGISRAEKLKVSASGSAILRKWRRFTTRPNSSTDGTKSTARKFSSSQILAWVCGHRVNGSNNRSQLKGFADRSRMAATDSLGLTQKIGAILTPRL